jgi:hypothetical protein
MSEKFFYVWERPMTQIYAFDSTKKLTSADDIMAEVQRLEAEGELDPELDNDRGEGRCFCGKTEVL